MPAMNTFSTPLIRHVKQEAKRHRKGLFDPKDISHADAWL